MVLEWHTLLTRVKTLVFVGVSRNGTWVFGTFLQKDKIPHNEGECQQSEQCFREDVLVLESSTRLFEEGAGC